MSTKHTSPKHTDGVSEVIGAMLLVVIALAAFAVIYTRVFPLPIPNIEANVKLAGFVDDRQCAVLQHVGGENITNYDIIVTQSDGRHVYHFNDSWGMGACRYPPINVTLFTQECTVDVTVVNYEPDGSSYIIFEGTLRPKDEAPGPFPPQTFESSLLTSLRTQSSDEDLIAYADLINATITPKTYIYSFWVKTLNIYSPFARLLLPFDTQNVTNVKDYSGLNNNGTINGATWVSTGKIGGAYQFNGQSYISIPYCLATPSADRITIETWIKTSQTSGTIISYNRSNYCELALTDGHAKWSTTATTGTHDLTGTTLLNNNLWHLIAATYNSTTGTAQIYVDGHLEATAQAHLAGTFLGTMGPAPGAIGKGTGIPGRQTILDTGFEQASERDNWQENGTVSDEITWSTLKYDSFETGTGSYTLGGTDAFRVSTYRHQGTYSIQLRDNSGTASSIYLTNSIDIDAPSYLSLRIDFWWMWRDTGWASGEDWFLNYYDGSAWQRILDVDYPSGFSKDVWYHKIVYINETDYTFPAVMRIQFQCDASTDSDSLYLDQIYINASCSGRIQCDFDRVTSSILSPHAGSYSLAGSGDFDPEYAAFNRSAINIIGYKDVQVSVWYSYKDTEAEDFFGFYYKNGTQWTPVFIIADPAIGIGQLAWAHVTATIPNSLHSLVLQFRWMTSATGEYLAIDDLTITGIPLGGEDNFTGLIDDVKVYPMDFPLEQIYQDYLQGMSGNNSHCVLVSELLSLGYWQCLITANNGAMDDVPFLTNEVWLHSYSGGSQT